MLADADAMGCPRRLAEAEVSERSMAARVDTQDAQCGKSGSVETLIMRARQVWSPSMRASGMFEPFVKDAAATLRARSAVR
ncbi:uncharacterized protein MYCGRDRAFT_105632 [Zymoseptoria tritici IPO323]|uniref:Uncharacterized protein n=1 Tax=Zymoseptoria tritici (strain CBS 115943 / IPO323) TaxID=336722 RepID=F9XJS6_ZYMTI|nr:uncharacterized protein MYCGRDRAFT_105632 [Zymoseptoria tritici IPO323]EGP84823.1 hypothetical protein MYCGRDRAFT_105632 [Zymoseptoria tritici IPO323]